MTIKETKNNGTQMITKWKMNIIHFITKIEFRVTLSNTFKYSYLVKPSCDGQNWTEIENYCQFDKKGGRRIFWFERRKLKYLSLVIEITRHNGVIGGTVRDAATTMM